MEQINLDDECKIVDSNIPTVIILDSSQEIQGNDVLSLNDSCIEEGEVDEVNEPMLDNSPESLERQPAFEIKFHQNKLFHKIGYKIMSVLQHTLNEENAEGETYELAISTEDPEQICVQAYVKVCARQEKEINGEVAVSQHSPIISPSELKLQKRREKEQSPDLSDLGLLFTIDTEPNEKLDTVQVPSYKRSIKDVLDDESAQSKKQKNEEDKCRRSRPNAACFNCGSTDHSLRECHKPRNMKRINRAKKAHCSKQERYHVDIEQRFAHLRPGVISDKLQVALGLRRGELPFFFYRMRVLGYPPGWLEDAKVAHSGISLFNSDGTEVLKSDEDEGEVDVMKHKYDIKKIVDFPGFNKDPGTNFYDDYKYHNVPAMNAQDMKEEYIKTLGDNIIKGYKRRKLKDLPVVSNVSISETSLEVADMEIEDAETTGTRDVVFTRPMPPPEPAANEVEKPPLPPPPPLQPPTPANITNHPNSPAITEHRSKSPTLADLEAQQLKLLQELQANTSIQTEAEDSLIDEVLALDSTQSELDESSRSTQHNGDFNAPTTPTTPLTQTSTDFIKESHIGTPLLKFSPFDKLPAGDNFKVGVSDVINFENLPDSTGKYEQMKVVIKKVRNIITKLHDEDD